MTHSYILFSIGPVQTAISQARRTQDLFIGSRILSWLTAAGLEKANETAEIIYPAFDTKTSQQNLPNRFLIRCEAHVVEVLKTDISNAISNHWLKIATQTQDAFNNKFVERNGIDVTINTVIWKRQVNHWLEIHCVDVPDTGNYQSDNQAINRILAARKLIRDFQAVEEPGEKCSITGEHEALHHKESGKASRKEVNAYWDAVRAKQRNLTLLSKGERLCALSVIKRFAHEAISELSPEGRFPSTSSIACSPFRAAILGHWSELQESVAQYLSALEFMFGNVFKRNHETPYFFRNGELFAEHFPYIENISLGDINLTKLKFCSLDGDFLYKEGLQPAILQHYVGASQPPLPEKLKDVQDKLQELYRAAERLNISPPSNYLAVLSMDGDKMGEQARQFTVAKEHTQFSQRLAEFASDKVVPIVEAEVPGRLVYAGGDDVLALIPAEWALQIADKLRIAFGECFKDKALHASTGIAFVHRTHPLQPAVITANSAQASAKNDFRRNAISAALLQRSGEPLYMGAKWDIVSNQEKYSVIKIIMKIADAMANNILSHSLPYDVEHIVYTFGSDSALPEEPHKKEFERVYKRRYQATDYETNVAGALLCQEIIAIGEYGVLDDKGKPDSGTGWQNLMGWLRLARFLAGEEVQRVAVP